MSIDIRGGMHAHAGRMSILHLSARTVCCDNVFVSVICVGNKYSATGHQSHFFEHASRNLVVATLTFVVVSQAWFTTACTGVKR